MSIFDAFRGVPDPKPRKPKLCSCCGKPHEKKTEGKSDNQPNSGKKQGDSDTKDGDLTEDDRVMLRLKAENPSRPWSDILEATGFKNKSEAVARWKETEHKNQEDSNEGNPKKQEQEQKKKKQKNKDPDPNPDREARDAKNREEGLRKKEEAKKNAEAGGDGNSKKACTIDDNIESSKSGQSSGKAKNGHSDGDGNDMKALADGYDKKKWQMVASKHYDKTGQRITAAQAKAMAEGK